MPDEFKGAIFRKNRTLDDKMAKEDENINLFLGYLICVSGEYGEYA
jgi:hypothetical protein